MLIQLWRMQKRGYHRTLNGQRLAIKTTRLLVVAVKFWLSENDQMTL